MLSHTFVVPFLFSDRHVLFVLHLISRLMNGSKRRFARFFGSLEFDRIRYYGHNIVQLLLCRRNMDCIWQRR